MENIGFGWIKGMDADQQTQLLYALQLSQTAGLAFQPRVGKKRMAYNPSHDQSQLPSDFRTLLQSSSYLVGAEMNMSSSSGVN